MAMCYKDRSWCSETKCKADCFRRFTDADRVAATNWWGGSDFPIQITSMKDGANCPGFQA